MSKAKKRYYIVEYISEIVVADTKEEAVAIAKQRIQDRDVEVDEENTCLFEDKDVLKEIEENEKRADKQESKATPKPKK
jgi:hypothetical protein